VRERAPGQAPPQLQGDVRVYLEKVLEKTDEGVSANFAGLAARDLGPPALALRVARGIDAPARKLAGRLETDAAYKTGRGHKMYNQVQTALILLMFLYVLRQLQVLLGLVGEINTNLNRPLTFASRA